MRAQVSGRGFACDDWRALYPVLAAMRRYGEDWLWPEGEEPPIQLVDRESGDVVRPLVVDENSGETIDVRKLNVTFRK